LLGIAYTEVAEAAERAEEIPRKGLRLLELVDARRELLLREATNREAEALLLLVQAKAEHGRVLRRRTVAGPCHRLQPSAIASAMAEAATVDRIREHEGGTVMLSGWLAGRRSSGKIHFLQLRDGTGTIQCVMAKADVPADVFTLADH